MSAGAEDNGSHGTQRDICWWGGQRERRQLQKEGNQNIDSFFLYSPVLSSVHSSSNHFDRGASGSVIPLLVHQCSLDVLMGYSR
jgi:hypothetical protein